jgi:hypothetical protein
MPELLYPHERAAIAAQMRDAIDAYCLKTYDDGHRNHLGASLIGDICNRRLWYGFRWVKSSVFDGRMQRLFNRGHKEEARFIEWLEGIGFKVWEHGEGGTQHRITGVEGHFGGSLDGIGQAPEWLALLAKIGRFLLEFKTYNQKQFDKLKTDGVKKTKPKHWVQMCTYGGKYGFRYAVYMAINKNDDEIYIEVVELDWKVGEEAEHRAYAVISSDAPPPRYSELPSHIECKFCDYLDVCHKGAAYEVNCRSCKFASPVKNGGWWCGLYSQVNGPLPEHIIKTGCPSWKPVGRNG